jgi:hypothetical protein
MARRDEILEKKRTQSFLCAPSYKREIEELGNPGKTSSYTNIAFYNNVITSFATSFMSFYIKRNSSVQQYLWNTLVHSM